MAFVVGEVTAYIVGDDSQFTKTINKVREEGDKAANEITKQFESTSKTFDKVGSTLSKTVTAPLVGVGTAAAWTGMRFEEAMSEVAAISGATGAELAALEKQAKFLGETTRFSASEAAAGMKFLAMAGFETNEVLAAMPGLLDLAAAAGMDLAAAADITSNILSGFAMDAAEASRVADVLAKTTSSSNTNVYQLGEAMKFVAPVAAGLGISVEEVSAAIGILGDNGIQASMAGTTLRSGLLRLSSPTKNVREALSKLGVELFDNEGRMLSLTEIISQLEVALADMTDQQKTATLEMLFGKNAVSGWMALIETGSAKLGNFTKALENSNGAAAEMARIMTDNTAGGLMEMRSALEGLSISIFEALAPAIKTGTELIISLTRRINEMDSSTLHMIVSVGAAAAALGPLALGAGKVLGALGPLVGTFGSVSKAMAGATTTLGAVKAGFTALVSPMGLVTAGLVGAGAAAVGLAHHLSQDALPEIELFGDGVSEATQQALQGFVELHEGAMRELTELRWTSEALTEEMGESLAGKLTQMNEQIIQGMQDDREAMIAMTIEMMGQMNDVTEAELNKTIDLINEYYDDAISTRQKREEEILNIIRNAYEEQRSLTETELKKINDFLDESLKLGIEILSEYQTDAIAIQESLRQQEGRISAERARQIVQDRIQQKEQAIAAIEEEYLQTVRWVTKMRDEVGALSAEQAEEIIRNATKQKEGAIAEIEEMSRNVIGQAQLAALEHISAIDWQTGEVLSKWQQLKRNLNGEYDETLINFLAWLEEQNIQLDKNQLAMLGLSERNYEQMRKVIAGALDMIKKDNDLTADDLVNIYYQLRTEMYSAGQNMMAGLDSGIKSKESQLKATARKVAREVNREFKRELDIRSPSRVMMRSGQDTVEGLRLGMEHEAQSLFRSIGNIARGILNELDMSRHLRGMAAQTQSSINQPVEVNMNNYFTPAESTPSQIIRRERQLLQRIAMEWSLR